MEFFKAFFLVLLFSLCPSGIIWLVEQPDTNMFVALGACLAYLVAFSYATVLVGIGIGEWR